MNSRRHPKNNSLVFGEPRKYSRKTSARFFIFPQSMSNNSNLIVQYIKLFFLKHSRQDERGRKFKMRPFRFSVNLIMRKVWKIVCSMSFPIDFHSKFSFQHNHVFYWKLPTFQNAAVCFLPFSLTQSHSMSLFISFEREKGKIFERKESEIFLTIKHFYFLL
jgi:hypothetical protein